MIGARVGGLPMTAHIAADDAKFAGQQRHPMMPETQIAPEAVLSPDRISLFPRIGEVVEFVIHLVIIGDNLLHFSSTQHAPPLRYRGSISPFGRYAHADDPPWHGVYTFCQER